MDIRARLETLYFKKRGDLVGFFRKKGFDLAASQDLAQDTFLQAVAHSKDFKGDAPLWTWVMAIAKNIYKNHLRYKHAKKRADTTVPIEDNHQVAQMHDGQPDPAHKVQVSQELALIQSEVASFPPRMKQCFTMRFFKKRTNQEIADALQIDLNTVKSHINSARQRLKQARGKP